MEYAPDENVSFEWIEAKQHLRISGQVNAYAHSLGDEKRWRILNGLYQRVTEIPAKNREESEQYIRVLAKRGALRQLINQQHDEFLERRTRGLAYAALLNAETAAATAKRNELKPEIGSDGVLRVAVPLKTTTHRLLRAVAIKRAAKTPGEEPSIGALLEDLVEKSRSELVREAGAQLKRELAKKK